MSRPKIYPKIVTPYPAPEPWMFDNQGNLIGFWKVETISRAEMKRRYPKAKKTKKGPLSERP